MDVVDLCMEIYGMSNHELSNLRMEDGLLSATPWNGVRTMGRDHSATRAWMLWLTKQRIA